MMNFKQLSIKYGFVFKKQYGMLAFSGGSLKTVPLGTCVTETDFSLIKIPEIKNDLIISQFTTLNRTVDQIPPMFDFVKYIELEYDKGFDREPTRKFLQNMANAKYCLSPHGHTPDCYRHWEAMYVNCIPVTLKHKYLEPFYDMPILFLDSWNQLTEKLLIDSYDELSKRSRDKLNIEYWLDMLEHKGT